MKSVLLIGLGRFGRRMARKLHESGHEVLAVDRNEPRVDASLEFVTSAQIGDASDPQFLASLGVRDFDMCVVAIGDDFQNSLETTALLKEQGARFVLSRASRSVQAKFLLRNGADDVIYPERQVADWAAMRYGSEHVFDYMQISREYAICEASVPESWVGKSVVQLGVRQSFGLNVLGVKRDGELDPMPGTEHLFLPDEHILVLGKSGDLQRFLKLK